jgi:hypothetical protein
MYKFRLLSIGLIGAVCFAPLAFGDLISFQLPSPTSTFAAAPVVSASTFITNVDRLSQTTQAALNTQVNSLVAAANTNTAASPAVAPPAPANTSSSNTDTAAPAANPPAATPTDTSNTPPSTTGTNTSNPPPSNGWSSIYHN